MDIQEQQIAAEKLNEECSRLAALMNIPGLKAELQNLESELADPAFWNNREKAKSTGKRRAEVESRIKDVAAAQAAVADLEALLDLLKESPESAAEHETESSRLITTASRRIEALRHLIYFTDPLSSNNAIVSIHPGAGGTESQDWADMLLRMYTRWADHEGFGVEMLDYQTGEEAGIKGATLLVRGRHAFGLLRCERGTHRLVRISPFDANRRRHTSFAAVYVLPEIDEEINIEIRPEDLKVDTYRASGAGGQHVNKTDSAIRITHLPSGVIVACQTERSQHKNRENAMRILRAKLYDLKEQEKQKELDKLGGEKEDIAWGRQIRSYVLEPYQLVKDHRTDHETSNVNAVLDGAINGFVEAYLASAARTRSSG